MLRERRYVDPANGRIYAIGYLPDGSQVEPAAARTAAQRAAVLARRGLAPELQEILERSAPSDLLPIAFWLRSATPDDLRPRLLAAADPEAGRRAAHAAAVARFQPGNEAFAARLRAGGFAVHQVADAWPIVCAEVPAAVVASWAADPAVDQAYYAYPRWYPEQQQAQRTMRTPTAWARGIGCNSSSSTKVLVNDVGDVTANNPFLPPIVPLTTLGLDDHATGVAGNIAFAHPDLRAAAAGLPLLYSGPGTSDASAPLVWSLALQQGISFGNCSWWNGHKGSIAFLDRFFDFTIRNFGVSMFKSNGNQGQTAAPYVTTPGCGYNMICSGVFDDQNDADWANDRMVPYSSYWDPIEGHDKPELVSPGDDVDTAGVFAPSWTQSHFSGTSSASPLTCGVAALLAEREPALLLHPELVKAVLMVSAWQNVEGDPLLSEYDGAGGVVAAAADAVLADQQFALATLTPASFQSGSYDVPFLAYAGDETRVIALWLSKADSAFNTDFLDLDLDAAVLDPHGQLVAVAASSKNPFELLHFVPAATGWHTLRLSPMRFNGVDEPLAVAWSSRLDAAVGEIEALTPPQLGRDCTLLFEDPYLGDLHYQAHVSLATLPSTTPVAPGVVLPLAQDALFTASAAWQDFTGTLGPLGRATATVHVPASPGLAGRRFYAAFYTERGGSARSLSPAAAFTVLP